MKSATERDPRSREGLPTEDAEVLICLSGIHATLLRCERSEAAIRAQLREQQVEVAQLEAELRADERALGSLRSTTADRVAIDVLKVAVGGASKAYHAAQRRLEGSRETTAPLLQQLVESLKKLNQDASQAREGLSSSTVKCYEGLLRLKKLPFVAYFKMGLCGECHLKLPSALAGAVLTSAALFRCPLCGRVLLPTPPVALS